LQNAEKQTCRFVDWQSQGACMVRGQSLVEAIKTLILGISAAERLVKLSRNLCMRFGIQEFYKHVSQLTLFREQISRVQMSE